MEEHSMGLLCSTQWTVLLSHTSSAMHQPALPLSLFHGSTASSMGLTFELFNAAFCFIINYLNLTHYK